MCTHQHGGRPQLGGGTDVHYLCDCVTVEMLSRGGSTVAGCGRVRLGLGVGLGLEISETPCVTLWSMVCRARSCASSVASLSVLRIVISPSTQATPKQPAVKPAIASGDACRPHDGVRNAALYAVRVGHFRGCIAAAALACTAAQLVATLGWDTASDVHIRIRDTSA